MADLHLAQEPHRQHVQPSEQQYGGKNHQRAVLGHYIGTMQKFLRQQPCADAASAEDAQHAHGSEEMQRACEVAEQEADRDQIEEDPESARDAIMRCTALAVHVADRDFADGRSIPRGQRRDEAVEFAIERDLVENVAAIGFEGRAKVVNVYAAQFGHDPVGAPRGNASQPEIVDTLLAPAADDVVPFCNLFQKHWDVGGVVLQIAIHSDDVFAARVIEAGGQGGSLAKVAPQLNHGYATVHGGDFAQQREGAITRAVVHQNDFEALAVHFHDRLETIIEVGNVFLLVVQRDNDGVSRHECLLYVELADFADRAFIRGDMFRS